MGDGLTLDLFAAVEGGPGSLSLEAEIRAVIADVLHRAQERGVSREAFAERMSYFAGERISVNALNDWASSAHSQHRISLARAAAFDAAAGGHPLVSLLASRLGLRVITQEEAVLVELGRIHQQERDLAERKRALQTLYKGGIK